MRKLFAVAAFLLVLPEPATAQQTAATAHIVSAANNFLASLDTGQRQRVLFAFNDNEQRARWSNLPTMMVPRGGISIKEMTLAQREAAMAVLAAALSPRGLEKVQQIMEGDEVNKLTDTGPGGGPGGGPPPDGKDGNTRLGGPNGPAGPNEIGRASCRERVW